MSRVTEEQAIRVLFLNYEYPPLGGGAANANAYLLKAYKEHREVIVDLVTASPDSEEYVTALSPTIYVHSVIIGKTENSLHHQSQKDILRYTWRGYQKADALLKKNKYDIIHAFFTVPCGAMAWHLGKKYNLPYIVSLRGSDVPGYSERFSFLYIFLRPLIRVIWRRASAVVANSEDLKKLALQSAPAQTISIIPNGVDTGKFTPSLLKDEEWIITAGATRLTERKGLHLIIEALPELLAIKPNIIFEVMGDGASLEKLKQLAEQLGVSKTVRFLGRISADNTPAYYSRAKVFILPSANEGMSNALLEALASGLPAIVTDTGGARELVVNGENGFIIARESEAIVEAVRKLLQNEDLRLAMAASSRKRAEKQSWQSVGDEYLSLYKQLSH